MGFGGFWLILVGFCCFWCFGGCWLLDLLVRALKRSRRSLGCDGGSWTELASHTPVWYKATLQAQTGRELIYRRHNNAVSYLRAVNSRMGRFILVWTSGRCLKLKPAIWDARKPLSRVFRMPCKRANLEIVYRTITASQQQQQQQKTQLAQSANRISSCSKYSEWYRNIPVRIICTSWLECWFWHRVQT